MAKEFNIARVGPSCQTCDVELPPGSDVVATLTETKDDFVRSDFCMPCWAQRPEGEADAGFFCTWRTRVPEPKARKKLFVDNDLLINFFERLAGTQEPAKINFRFVLALVLMRKRLLVYGRSDRRSDGSELWHMVMKHSQAPHEVVDPKMDEAMIDQVSGQLGQILEGEL
ncbi:MAG: hypothetical protein WCK05_07165 [Planctomycetota bacterium]|jgi:hypothetical protein